MYMKMLYVIQKMLLDRWKLDFKTSYGARMDIGRFVIAFLKAPDAFQTSYDLIEIGRFKF